MTGDKLEILETCAIDIEALMLRLTVQAAHLLPEVAALPNRVGEKEQPAARIIH